MKRITIFTVFFIFSSCVSYKLDNFQYRNDDKNVWINTFKSEVFYQCLKDGYGNDTIFKMMSKKDLFNSYDAIDFKSIDTARVLGNEIIKKMPKPFIKIDSEEEHHLSKNFISYSCLNYYASRELDSIARSEYKKQFSKKKKSNY